MHRYQIKLVRIEKKEKNLYKLTNIETCCVVSLNPAQNKAK